MVKKAKEQKWDEEKDIPKLSFRQRMQMRSVIKNLKEANRNVSQLLDDDKKKKAMAEAIIEVSEILEIKNKEGKPATKEELQAMEIGALTDLFEDVIKELERTV
jgi:hypothetical protein